MGIKINIKIKFEEYLKFTFFQTYKNGWTIFTSFIGLLMLIVSALYYLGQIPLTSPPFFQLFFGLFAVVLMPISIYVSTKKNFSSHGRFQENIIYEFLEDKLKITGESFNSELQWEKSYKIEELKSWFLIYESKQIAIMIPKSNLSSEIVKELNIFFSRLKRKNITVKLSTLR